MMTYHYLKFFVQVFIFQDLRIIKIFMNSLSICSFDFILQDSLIALLKAKVNKDYQVFEVIQVYKFTSEQITFTVCQVSSFPKQGFFLMQQDHQQQ
jgi:hypothetical protein